MADQDGVRTVHLKVEGMGCGGCASAVRQAPEEVPGVVRALVELSDASAAIEADAATTPEALVRAVEQAGYEAQIRSD